MQKDLRQLHWSRRRFLSVAGAGLAFGGCTTLRRGVPSALTSDDKAYQDFLAAHGPIDRSQGPVAAAEFFGDNPERAHAVLWKAHSKGTAVPVPREIQRVVVVGGGMSGLLAAYYLRDLNPIVLEQSTRFGGNAQAQSWAGIDYSIGAAYFAEPTSGSPIAGLLADLGIDTSPVADVDIVGFGGNDTAYGGDGNDTVQGTNLGVLGSQSFFGGNGNDLLVGNTSADTLDGGAGNDSLDGWGGADNLLGREGNDRLRGTGTLDGGEGDDFLFVGNVLAGGVIASRLIGGNGNDTLLGGVANDTLEGGEGNDSLASGQGNDRIDGGIGFDIVDFRGEPFGITADLASGFVQTTRGFSTLVSIEQVLGSWNASDRIAGSENAEAFYGDVGNDTLIGRGGDDSLYGGNGDDWIQGDSGVDRLAGGAGTDRFVYLSTSDRGDFISDFVSGLGGDVLDISGILSSLGYAGVSPAFDGYLRLVASGSDTLVQIDADGKLGNFNFETITTLQGVNPATLVAAG